jgi:hypothetical protein
VTTRELIQFLSHHPAQLAIALGGPALLAWVLGWLHAKGQGAKTSWKYAYAAIVYATCIPGMAACALLGYTLLFTHENLLDANVLIYFAPVAAMIPTLGLVGRNAAIDELPGFDRLWGLMLMLGMAFMGVFILSRTSFGVFFRGSFLHLVLVAVAIFFTFKYGARLAFGRKA